MTIGIEATKAFEQNKTGVGWYSYYIIKEIIKIKNKNIDFVLYINPQAKIKIPNLPLESNSQIKYLKWPFKNLWTQIRLSIETISKPPDRLFIPAHIPPIIHPKKTIAVVHDLAFKQYKNIYSKKELTLQEIGIKRILKTAWKIIVPSLFTKNEIKKYYHSLYKNNIYVIRHGVDHSIFKFKNQKKDNNEKIILYIGRIESKKNIKNLIKAFNIFKNQFKNEGYKLLLIGPKGFGSKDIEKEINKSNYKKDIRYINYAGRKKISKYLSMSEMFIFPSLYEGFGMPILEAMATGTPVICSNIPALKEIGKDIPLYFNPKDPFDIANKIIYLIKNIDIKTKKVQKGLKYAKHFTWEKTAKKTLEIIYRA